VTPVSRETKSSETDREAPIAPLRVAANRDTEFLPSKHGFPFANCFAHGTPVLEIGPFAIGDISRGLCGGMIYLALDYFFSRRTMPPELNDKLLTELRHRLLESFDFPFGYLRYYESQWRPERSVSFAGVTVVEGITRRTLTVEWPKVKALLDAGSPVPLGLVQVKTYNLNPWILGSNHQVLAYMYEWIAPLGDVCLRIYDPNYPSDDTVTLTLKLDDLESGDAVIHSVDGPRVRGFFITAYRKPIVP